MALRCFPGAQRLSRALKPAAMYPPETPVPKSSTNWSRNPKWANQWVPKRSLAGWAGKGVLGLPTPLALLPSTPPPLQPAVLQLPEAPTLQVAKLWLGPEWAGGGGGDAVCLPHL